MQYTTSFHSYLSQCVKNISNIYMAVLDSLEIWPKVSMLRGSKPLYQESRLA